MLPKNADMQSKSQSLLQKSSYKIVWITEKGSENIKKQKQQKSTGGKTETRTDVTPP